MTVAPLPGGEAEPVPAVLTAADAATTVALVDWTLVVDVVEATDATDVVAATDAWMQSDRYQVSETSIQDPLSGH